MKIIVCIKQVPDTNEVKIDPKTGTLIREGVPSIINHDDKNALEEALKLKDKYEDVHITVLTMGPPQADVALREALAMGADRAILLSDRAFAGSDTWATAKTLAAAIKKIGEYDLIFCGRQAIDGDTAQVGPQLAENLDVPQITYVTYLQINGKEVKAHRALEDGYQVLITKMPCLLTAIKELNEPRYPSVRGIFEAYNGKQMEVWSSKDIEISLDETGLNSSPTNVRQTFTPSPKGQGMVLDGCGRDTVCELLFKLSEKHFI
ncbi:MAG: electron transfer flavoprotein subunit beta/FixA family protein [Clostridiales bacterium]|nr:electron transfer flavoprotein subunit beta/FixA family protein [Clostridiales bacterium]